MDRTVSEFGGNEVTFDGAVEPNRGYRTNEAGGLECAGMPIGTSSGQARYGPGFKRCFGR
jgi:hypothetical protein